MLYTNYFVLGDDTEVRFIKNQEIVIRRIIMPVSEEENKNEEMLEEGFYDGWTGNIKYLNLIESTGVANLDKETVLNQLSDYADINEKVIQHEASSLDVNPINVKIVYEHIWWRKSINWISDEQGIEKLEVARIINKFRKSQKQRWKQTKDNWEKILNWISIMLNLFNLYVNGRLERYL